MELVGMEVAVPAGSTGVLEQLAAHTEHVVQPPSSSAAAAGAVHEATPAADGAAADEGAAAAGAAAAAQPKKRKRKREQLEKLQIASYIRQQTARAPVRKWTREWVPVRTIISGGEVKLRRWTTNMPMAPSPPPLPPLDAAAADAGVPAFSLGAGGKQQSAQDLAAMAGPGLRSEAGLPGAAGMVPSMSGGLAAATTGSGKATQQQQAHKTGPGAAAAAAAAAAAGSAVGGPGPSSTGSGLPPHPPGSGAAAGAPMSAKAAAKAAATAAALAAGKPVCPECGKVFASNTSLKKHMHVHGEKTFLCDFPGCNRAFVDAGKLARHKLTHSTERNFVCPQCGKACVTDFTLRNHWRAAHKDIPMPPELQAQPKPPKGAASSAAAAAAAAAATSAGGGGAAGTPAGAATPASSAGWGSDGLVPMPPPG